MTWHETINYIRKTPEYHQLVFDTYICEDLIDNVERFSKSKEFLETLSLIKKYQPEAHNILDLGSGNGISAIAFAINGYSVTALEPDTSDTVGSGAIKKLIAHYNLQNVDIVESYAEDFASKTNKKYDVVYARQAMHHAYNLDQFVEVAAVVLKTGGIFFTVRDHVVKDDKEKDLFLQRHPLQKYYGGENAFTVEEYEGAMKKAHLNVALRLGHYDSVINFSPAPTSHINMKKLIKVAYKIVRPVAEFVLPERLNMKFQNLVSADNLPGRLYSFIGVKKGDILNNNNT